MRTKSGILAAAFLAALFALASCDKSDIAVGGGIQQPTGRSRVIAVSFQNNSTKTELDGLQPKFVGTDVIKVSNGSATEDCNVSIEDDVASITTKLSGPLTMVYPAAAWSDTAPYFKVSTEQDGTFASANICKAEIAAGAESATFENQTALFKVTPPDGVKQFTITSLKPIVDGVARTDTAVAINTEGADDAAKLVVSVGGASSDLTTFYVSLAAGVNLTDLKFEYQTTGVAGMDGAIKGITEKSLTASSVSNATAANTLYTIDANNWHPYVVIAGKKWATMNVGATTVAGNYETCYGDYFAWGATEPYYTSIDYYNAMIIMANDWKSGKSDGYSWSNAPFNNGSSDYNSSYFTTNKSEWLTDADVLKPAYDAATANWGSSWRMPTDEEFKSLRTACTGDEEEFLSGAITDPEVIYDPETITDGGIFYWLNNYNNVNGILFVDESDISKRVFFPSAGFFLETGSSDGCWYGLYWSSSLSTGGPSFAHIPGFEGYGIDPSNYDRRYYGFSVRPLSE